jgi:hypothetical protein
MTEATKLLDTHEPKGRATVASEAAGAAGRNARSLVMTVDQQKYRQAQEDWVRAKLRKESGAAIPVKEMDDEIATYFPLPFDNDPTVIEQKRQSREVATKAMVQAAGRGAPPPDTTAKAPKPIKDDAEYAALPPGSEFIAPDGSRRRKPK